MLVFLLLSAAVVAGAVPAQSQLLGLPGPMAVLYLLEALTVAALAATWRWHWAPSARAADRRLLQERARR